MRISDWSSDVCSSDLLDTALAGRIWEAIVVDDNSPDGTADAAREIARNDRRVRVIQRIGRRGLSTACIEGMCATAAPLVAVIDGDLQHDETLLPRMIDAPERSEERRVGKECVSPCRYGWVPLQ